MIEELHYETVTYGAHTRTPITQIITSCPYIDEGEDGRHISVGGLICRKQCRYNHNKAYSEAQIVKCGFKNKIEKE